MKCQKPEDLKNSTRPLTKALPTSGYGTASPTQKMKRKKRKSETSCVNYGKQAGFLKMCYPTMFVIFLLTLFYSPAEASVASWYSAKETCPHNPNRACPTASRKSLYDLDKKGILYAASNRHAFGTRLEVTNVVSGKSVVVTVEDRGGFEKYGRSIDLSKEAFSRIGKTEDGLLTVRIKEVQSV